MLSLKQMRFCAAECERQQSGEISVYNMCNALSQFDMEWCYSHECVQELGRLIEPTKNANGYRRSPVLINYKGVAWTEIPRQMQMWLDWLTDTKFDRDIEIMARDAYISFEQIHPFIDGNGRVGAILYNFLRGTLDDLIAPPNVFGAKEQEGS